MNGLLPTIGLDKGGPANFQIPTAPADDSFRDNELLIGITPEAYAQIEKQIKVVRFAPEQVVFEENEEGDCLYLIVRGSVRISKKGRAGQQETLQQCERVLRSLRADQ